MKLDTINLRDNMLSVSVSERSTLNQINIFGNASGSIPAWSSRAAILALIEAALNEAENDLAIKLVTNNKFL